MAFGSKVSTDMLSKLSHFLYQVCEPHGFTFIDSIAVKHNDLWNDGVNLLKSGTIIIADNLIHNINYFFTSSKSIYLKSVNKVYGNSDSTNCTDNKSSDESIKNASSNSLFQIKKLRIKNTNKFIWKFHFQTSFIN